MPFPIGASITVDSQEADHLLTSIGQRAADLRPFFHDFLDPEVTEFFEKQFESQGAHGGAKWAPIKPLTVALRSRPGHGFRGPTAILVDTDQMRREFVHAGGLGLRVIKPKEYRRGVTSGPAQFHQEGWTARSIFGIPRKVTVKVPARPIVPKEIPRSILSAWEAGYKRFLEWGKA